MSFTFIVLGYKFCYPWIPSQCRNKKSLKIGDGPLGNETELDCRDFGTKERESKGREVIL